MTCEECQPLAIDLARGRPPFGIGEAVQRGDVLSHIARCKRCAEWLAKQEALTEALRAAAEADAALSAPPSVEAHVMAAWRARQAKAQAPIASAGSLERAAHVAHAEHRMRAHATGLHATRSEAAQSETTQSKATQPQGTPSQGTLLRGAPSQGAPSQGTPSQGTQPRTTPAMPGGDSSGERRTAARGWKPAGLAWPTRLPDPTSFGFPKLAGFAAAAAVVIFVLSLVSLRSLNTPPAEGGVGHQATDASANAEASAAKGESAAAGGSTAAGAAPAASASTAAGAATVADASVGAAGPASASTTPPAPSDPSDVGASTRAPVTGTNAAMMEVLPEKGSKGRPPPRAVVRRVAAARGFDAARGASSRRSATSGRGASELAGPAFVLLPYVEPLRPTEMRHIMRVRMSRALVVAGDVQAGNVDGGMVLADVLVGEDGTARAVRIVQ